MVDEPHSSPLADDITETEDFLCAVAAECIQDALFVLERVNVSIKPDLEIILSALVHKATAASKKIEYLHALTGQAKKTFVHTPSPAAGEIAETYIEHAEAHRATSTRKPGAIKRVLHNPATARTRQQVVLHLVEALSLLPEEDRDIALPLTVAVDRLQKRSLLVDMSAHLTSSQKIR